MTRLTRAIDWAALGAPEGGKHHADDDHSRGRDFIALSDFTKEEIETILDTAFELKLERARGVRHHLLEDATIYMMFYNKSLRTRNSFETGIHQLGGHAVYLDSNAVYTPAVEGKEQAFVTERLDDVAKVLSATARRSASASSATPWAGCTATATPTSAPSPKPPTFRSSTWKTTCTTPARASPT